MIDSPVNLFPDELQSVVASVFGEKNMQAVLVKMFSPVPDENCAESENLSNMWLHPDELSSYTRYKLRKRQMEFLTGRYCAKKAVVECIKHGAAPPKKMKFSEINIRPRADGRPSAHLTNIADRQRMDISIAHSGDFAVAMAAGRICGIDLQQPSTALLRVQSRYCTATELQLFEDAIPQKELLPGLTLLWAAKEAAKKGLSFYRMPGFLDLQTVAVSSIDKSFHTFTFIIRKRPVSGMPERVSAVASHFQQYGLALCILNEEPPDA